MLAGSIIRSYEYQTYVNCSFSTRRQTSVPFGLCNCAGPYTHSTTLRLLSCQIEPRWWLNVMSCHLASCQTCTCEPNVISNIALILGCMVATRSLMIESRFATHLCALNNLVIVHSLLGIHMPNSIFGKPTEGKTIPLVWTSSVRCLIVFNQYWVYFNVNCNNSRILILIDS